jgi:EAL domain-containing protein (putative c-di-GMP-specific phosphodiesterase class I)
VKQAAGLLPESLVQAGTHAATAIPILDDTHLPVALLLLFGRYPRQFDSKYMQHFTRNLQLRGNEIWQRSMRPPPPVPYEQAVALRRRLFKDGLRILLQPVVDLHDGRLLKAEALARLELENGTLVGPDTFLPLLRHTELNTLFRRGLDLALGELVELERQGVTIDMTVNIAPHTLSEPECVKWVVDILDAHGVAPQRLVLEILENQRVDSESRDSVVHSLVAHGVHFAIDDLGSGYSSLRRLASLPFDLVKVDQDLLSRVHVDPVQSVSLISAVVQIGRDFGCRVIAEGLEDQGMIEVARLLGADMGQGYLIARPMPASELPAWASGFMMPRLDLAPRTLLGALAFQWLSIRHGSMHTEKIEDCPISLLLPETGEHAEEARRQHEAVHADPGDEVAAHKLLDCLQEAIREQAPGNTQD